MPLLNAAQLAELRQIIQDGATALAVTTFGDEVTPEELQRLVDEGYVDPAVLDDLTLTGFEYGALMGKLPEAGQMEFPQFAAYMRKDPIPLSSAELEAVAVARQRAGQYCRGLGNRYSDELGRIVVNADAELAQRLREGIQSEVSESLAARESQGILVRRLRQMSGQMTRDWTRIANTETHIAHQEGLFESVTGRNGAGTLFAKVPEADACEDCRRLYLGEDGKPAVHPASWWASHGSSNAGRKRAAWQPVLGAMHPWCFPPGQLVTTARGPVPIEAVRVGDLVVTAKGRWRPVRQLFRHYFEGEVVDLEAGDERLAMTGNHPVGLASGDWQEAESIREGAELLMIPNPVNPPSQSNQVGRLAAILLCLDRAGVPVTAIDLDGHLCSFPAQVNQVASDEDVVAGGDAVETQSSAELPFQGGMRMPGLGANARGDLLVWAGGSAPRLVRRPGQALALIGAGGLETDLLSFAARARLSSSVLDSLDDGAAAHPELAGYLQYGSVLLEVETQDQVDIEFAHEAILPACSAIVNKVGRRSYRGYVYNLGVADDQSYLVAGVAVHNCRCQLVEVPEGFEFDEDWSLVPTPEPEGDEAIKGRTPPFDLEKALPVGTVHTWADGRRYRKEETGWVPADAPEEPSERTGVIRVDPELVRATVDKLLEGQKWNRHGVLAGPLETREQWIEGVDARGMKRQIRVIFRGMPEVNDPRGVRGSHQVAVAADDPEQQRHTVFVDAAQRVGMAGGWDRGELAETARSVLSHELTHAADPGLAQRTARGRGTSTRKIRDEQGPAAYYNNPAEMTARLQQIWRELTDRKAVAAIAQLRDEAAKDGDSWRPSASSHLAMSETWNRIEEHLTPQNRERVLKVAALAWDAIARGKVDPSFEKSRPLQGRRIFQGFPISIENRPGSVRHWHDEHTGEEGCTKFKVPYGYIRGTLGVDGDEVDVFLGPDESSEIVYVIHQMRAPDFREFDEDKVMLGFSNALEARRAYRDHYTDPRFFGAMTPMSLDEFRRKVAETAERPGMIKGGPFIGPRGGKWADPQHTIPWHESVETFAQAQTLGDKAAALRKIASDHDLYSRIAMIGGSGGRPRHLPDEHWAEVEEIAKDPKHPEHAEVKEWVEKLHAKVRSRVAPTDEDRKQLAEERKRLAVERKRERAERDYERQGEEVEEGTPPSKLRGKMVWLYHGTSSKHLEHIRKEGLRTAAAHGRKRSNVGSTATNQANPNHVYLTARATGEASAAGYARAAAYKTGGEPVILRVLVRGDDLARDPDDQDLGSGRYQYVTDEVTPDQIKEIDGERIEKAAFSGYAAQVGTTHAVGGMGNHGDPARTPGANVLNRAPVTEWPPLLDRPLRGRRRMRRAADRFDLRGTARSEGGYANPPRLDQVQAERGEVDKGIGRVAVTGHRYREELEERQRQRVVARESAQLEEDLQDYHRGSKP